MKVPERMVIPVHNAVVVLSVTKADTFVPPVMLHTGNVLRGYQSGNGRASVDTTEIRHRSLTEVTRHTTVFFINSYISGARGKLAFILSKVPERLIGYFITDLAGIYQRQPGALQC
ncbi:hypothetical protein EWD94_24420 [Salmonella enterica subsp. enterica serovar Newport]|nr:hypothetical protein [Salmonella enterica subsp. enterica serovar Newport]